ncbi:MAG: hypothetical protein Q8N99_03625 [Nanoarchaeota archaeon]|nr:hypothetical protein [Nanoarchaeota archaeon]
MINKELDKIISSSYKLLEEFCMGSCNARCCKEGFLRLDEKGESHFINRNPQNIIDKKENIVIFSTHPRCPFLSDNNQCKIHKNKLKPVICSLYPIKVIGDKDDVLVIFHPSCRAVYEGVLNENIRKIRALGYIVVC